VREVILDAAADLLVYHGAGEVTDILTSATSRGDLASSIDIPQAAAAKAGPLFRQHVMVRTSIDDHLITTTVSQFLNISNETRSR
jgi:hypothetical protein